MVQNLWCNNTWFFYSQWNKGEFENWTWIEGADRDGLFQKEGYQFRDRKLAKLLN